MSQQNLNTDISVYCPAISLSEQNSFIFANQIESAVNTFQDHLQRIYQNQNQTLPFYFVEPTVCIEIDVTPIHSPAPQGYTSLATLIKNNTPSAPVNHIYTRLVNVNS